MRVLISSLCYKIKIENKTPLCFVHPKLQNRRKELGKKSEKRVADLLTIVRTTERERRYSLFRAYR